MGKPHRPLFEAALERAGGGRPLVVGDRIDTDIAGAAEMGWDSLLVFTRVATPTDLVRADHLPTSAANDLSALTRETPPSVHPATGGYAGAVERLLRNSGLDAEGVGGRLADTLIAVTEADSIVGTVALEHFGPVAHLRSLAVDPHARGAYVGTLLCAHAVREARTRGARKIYAVTETAAGFFEDLGFDRSGTRESVPEPIAATPLIRDQCAAGAVVLRLDLEGAAGTGARPDGAATEPTR
ncbi:MAG: GNAT family N-acetyltransferase [Actinomycetota bacterium]|nr:GNAT family N-acetyltransferase [Actinomycetota bacterium]